MESYGTLGDLQAAFAEFANKVPFYGSVVACADDPHVVELLPRLTRRVVTYGFDEAATVHGTDVELGAFGGRCRVRRRGPEADEPLGLLELSVPGRHNLQNALAAVAVGEWVGVGFQQVASALASFHGAERRFERHGEVRGVLIVDDYGHHPTEIRAVLAAARATFDRRLVVIFQPHRYSRTQQLFEAFGPALRTADEIVVTGIYSAGEDPIAGVSAASLAESIRRGSGRPVRLIERLDQVVPEVVLTLRPGDVVITLGAGSVGTLPAKLKAALSTMEATR
jgi:UDP-N-acetylmuramate--alanine ligase